MDGIDVSWGSHSPPKMHEPVVILAMAPSTFLCAGIDSPQSRCPNRERKSSLMEQNSRDMLADGIESKPGTKSSLMEQNSGDMLADGIEARPGMKSSLMERVVSTLPDKGLADVCHDCMVGAEIVHKLH